MQIPLRTYLPIVGVVLSIALAMPAAAIGNSTFLLSPTTPIEIDFNGANGLTGPDFLTQGFLLTHFSNLNHLNATLYDNGVPLGTFTTLFPPNFGLWSDAAAWASPTSLFTNASSPSGTAHVDLSGLLLHGDQGKIVFSTLPKVPHG